MKWFSFCLAASLIIPISSGAKSKDVQWHNLGPRGGGWLPSVCISPHDNDLMFVGCDVAGLFRSTSAGASWHNQSQGLSDYFVGDIVVHPAKSNVVFASTWSGVNKSDDGGLTWRAVRSGFPQTSAWRYSCPIACVRFDPENQSVVYAFRGCSHGIVAKSEDRGESLRKVFTNRFAADFLVMESGVWVVATTDHQFHDNSINDGVLISRDQGQSWQNISGDTLTHRNVVVLAEDAHHKGVLCAGTQGAALFACRIVN